MTWRWEAYTLLAHIYHEAFSRLLSWSITLHTAIAIACLSYLLAYRNKNLILPGFAFLINTLTHKKNQQQANQLPMRNRTCCSMAVSVPRQCCRKARGLPSELLPASSTCSHLLSKLLSGKTPHVDHRICKVLTKIPGAPLFSPEVNMILNFVGKCEGPAYLAKTILKKEQRWRTNISWYPNLLQSCSRQPCRKIGWCRYGNGHIQ